MKRRTLLVVIIASILVISCKDNASSKVKKENVEQAEVRDAKIKLGGAKISFDKTEHDFGTIKEGDIVETVFLFTNTGKSELIISSAKGSC